MAKVLVLDDDRDYCEELCLALTRDGHEVLSARCSSEAINLGSLFRPDVLVTDWLLQESVDGLNVSEVLELVRPDMQIILITGFASDDLKSEAKYQEVFEFVEKPFHLGHIRRSVDKALLKNKENLDALPVGILELDSKGAIIYANPTGAEMLGQAAPEGRWENGSIAEILELDGLPALAGAESNWLTCALRGDNNQSWKLRMKRFADVDNILLAVLEERFGSYMFEPVVYRLLGIEPPPLHDMRIAGHLLIMDDYEQIRRVAAAILRECKCVCHTARTPEEVLRLVERDKKIQHVILDCEMPEDELKSLVDSVKELRPSVEIIGTSSDGYKDHYSGIGIEHFLTKPWSDEDLVSLVGSSHAISSH